MMYHPPWLKHRSVLALALLLAGITAFQAAYWPKASYLADEATPDCDQYPADPFPERQRVRHLQRLGVDRWHAAGHRGAGIKIAVLDTGFRGYREHLGKALPARVTARSF